MYKQLDLYKNLSIELLNLLKEDKFDEIDEILDKRSLLIKEIYKNQQTEFKKLYVESNAYDIDKEIKSIFEKKIGNIKDEIKIQKKIKQANYSYINKNVENINIFNKKV
ncbi:hypothetical protein [Romboutsia sp.]|uniref:hypothetical protein n=1 Tax=Romboutsia sp. TaxID=1965302 RepID=UPI002B6935A4|nr:hypothetical protein [Romboutsia sp.]HSQ88377.1 hypothetical protein [Romboutsia sp.]